MGSGFWRPVVAVFLIILGVLLLLQALGITRVSVGDVFLAVVAVLAVLVGLAMLRRSRRRVHGAFHDRFFGTIRVGDDWQGGAATYQLGVGEMVLDLRRANLPEGEHRLDVNGLVGKLEVLAPQDLALSVDAEVTVGSVHLLGQTAQGFLRSLTHTSPDYANAKRKLRLNAELAIGEIDVHRRA